MARESMPRWVLATLCIAASIVALPFAPWIVLAVWMGRWASRRIHAPLMKALGNRRSLSATLTIVGLLVFLVPIAAVVASVVVDAITLVQRLMASDTGKTVLEQLASGPGTGDSAQSNMLSVEGIVELVRTQGSRAWSIVSQVAGATAHFAIGALILIAGIYGVLVEGDEWRGWIDKNAPLAPTSIQRLADAFVETGRGLAYGIVGAGLIQSVVATIAYIVLGVPSALALGMLTLLFSVIPAVGTAMVWAPVAAGLAVTGRTGAAITLAVIGVAVIGSVDNLARPWLARRGQLKVPGYVLLIAMFGGIELIGGWGLILGPLVVRLAKEAIAIRSESQNVIPL